MAIRKRAGALFVASASALALGLGASTALAAATTHGTAAATTLKVRVSHGGKYKARTNKTVLTDNGVSVTCTSTPTTRASKATGRIPSGTHTGTSPVKVGTTKTLVFHHCSGPLGAVTVKVHNLPYKVKVDSVTRRGRTDGMITGVSTHVTMTGCSFDVTGRAPGWYSNARHRLHVTPKLPIKPLNRARLTVKNVNGCAGVVSNGDHPTYKATYKLNRAITIHSKKV